MVCRSKVDLSVSLRNLLPTLLEGFEAALEVDAVHEVALVDLEIVVGVVGGLKVGIGEGVEQEERVLGNDRLIAKDDLLG